MTDAVDPSARIVAHLPLGLNLFAIGRPLQARAKFDQAVRTYNEVKAGPVDYRYGMDVGALICLQILVPRNSRLCGTSFGRQRCTSRHSGGRHTPLHSGQRTELVLHDISSPKRLARDAAIC
jgi:hypothetical protein